MRPTTVPGALPLIGHLIQFGSKPEEFLSEASKKYGDAFRIKMGTRPVIFLVNPHDIDTVYRRP